ncbi:glycosyltransferase family 32 protein [Dissoconium aciculare CBS 342.82]|uniref:Glycosyltransferase family 32 protein n=1 Tax=Dissoconium aciculare CBS 342.82 TaxID=1314786 RepID=A0A6J3LTD7_9PEZI|nr:glycosyltransferase family 32 protein [Dissoconium aciculare CBS 342.82]KAF1818913.1 glycosyltransferase family 32 protein [Dissoconium aciculare CBS 342.82]
MTYPRYLSIKAAILRLNATKIKIHIYESGLDTDNRWWRQIASHVTLVPEVRPQFGPHGLPIQSVRLEHQSDLVRLAVLAREGGIYLDTDVYVLKPFTDLLSSTRDVLMGHEGGNRYGLCNAVIISRPNSAFISKWRASYRTFDPKGWNQHSVQKPKQLQVQFPELICPLSPAVFFWPTWVKKHIFYMHEPISQDEKNLLQANMTAFDGVMYEDQLVVHAWGREAREYLSVLSPETIRNDTRFNVLVRDIAMAEL